MRHSRNILLLILAALSAATFLTTKSLIAKGQPPPSPQTTKETLNERLGRLPITDFIVQEPADQEKKLLRRARSSRNNPSVSLGGVKPPVLNDNMEPVLLHLPLSDQSEEPGIPASNSDAVVTGTINDVNAYISSDRTTVYSEVTLNIEEVLKQDPRYPLVSGLTLNAERPGGAVRFPSGKILRRGQLGRNIPEAGRRYLLFLKYNEDGKDFSIVTGYELAGNLVLPLDGTDSFEKGGHFSQFAAYERNRGAEVSAFLNNVRALIDSEQESRPGGQLVLEEQSVFHDLVLHRSGENHTSETQRDENQAE